MGMHTLYLKTSMAGFAAVILFLIPFSTAMDPSERLPGLLADYPTGSLTQERLNDQKNLALWGPDHHLAALTIYMEARGESFAGKLAVAAVIRNRIKLKYQSDGTINGTVLRRKQFQPWNHRHPNQVKLNGDDTRMRDSVLAWKLVQDGRNVVDGAVLFFNPHIARTPNWAIASHKVATIGRHEFYRPMKRTT